MSELDKDVAVIEVHNPASGDLVGTVPVTTPDDVAAAVRELRLYQPEWEAIGPAGRKQWLLKMQDWLIDNTEHLAAVLQSETAKPRVDAIIDPAFAVDILGYYARRAGKFLADEHPSPHSPLARVKTLTVAYRPYPVVGVITPWNFPLAMPAIDVFPALAAGAAVILKPSEVTPLGRDRCAAGVQGGHRRGRDRRGRGRERRLHPVHRFHRDRPQDRGRLRGTDGALQPRARR